MGLWFNLINLDEYRSLGTKRKTRARSISWGEKLFLLLMMLLCFLRLRGSVFWRVSSRILDVQKGAEVHSVKVNYLFIAVASSDAATLSSHVENHLSSRQDNSTSPIMPVASSRWSAHVLLSLEPKIVISYKNLPTLGGFATDQPLWAAWTGATRTSAGPAPTDLTDAATRPSARLTWPTWFATASAPRSDTTSATIRRASLTDRHAMEPASGMDHWVFTNIYCHLTCLLAWKMPFKSKSNYRSNAKP